jgi:hypothetical protein
VRRTARPAIAQASDEASDRTPPAKRCDLTTTAPGERWDKFRKMHLGGQPINGRDGGVPPHISGEYVTQAYVLLWGMVRNSLGRVGRGILDRKTVKMALRHPVAFLNALFFLMRREYVSALASIATTAGLIVGVAGGAYLLGSSRGVSLCVGAIVILLLFMSIVAWAVPRLKRRTLALTLLPATFLLILGVGIAIALHPEEAFAWWPQLARFVTSQDGQLGFVLGAVVVTGAWLFAAIYRGVRRAALARATRARANEAARRDSRGIASRQSPRRFELASEQRRGQ